MRDLVILTVVRYFSIIGLVVFIVSIFKFDLGQAGSQMEKVGNLTGTITFIGKLPQIRKFNLATYPDPYYCGRISDGKGWRLGPRASVTPNSRLTGAIVFIKDLKTGKQLEKRTNTVKSLDCRFTPYIDIIRKGDDLKFENWDPVLHQIEVFQATSQGGRLLFREDLNPYGDSLKSDFLQSEKRGIHQMGPPLTYEVREEGILFFRCPLHEYMEAWALALSHPYFAISSEGGEFLITDIPAGTYTLVVWHPIGQTEQSIDIKQDETLQLTLDFQPTQSTFYREPEVKTNPFGIDLLGDSQIIPSVELQKE